MTANSGKDGTTSTVVVRDGVLLVKVTYEVSELGEGGPRTSPGTVRDTAQRLAAELLKVLPPKGK